MAGPTRGTVKCRLEGLVMAPHLLPTESTALRKEFHFRIALSISRVLPTYAATAKSVPRRRNFNGQQSAPVCELDVIDADRRLRREDLPRGRDQNTGMALALCHKRFHLTDSAAKRQCLPALGNTQIHIPRADGESIRITHDGAHHNFGAEPQVGNHPPQHCDLRRVFLPEECAIGFSRNQQLGHNRCHPAKMAGPRCAIESIAKCPELRRMSTSHHSDKALRPPAQKEHPRPPARRARSRPRTNADNASNLRRARTAWG